MLNGHTLKIREQDDIIKLLLSTIEKIWRLVINKAYSHVEIRQDTERVCQIFIELRKEQQRLIEVNTHTHTHTHAQSSTVSETFKSEIIRILLNKKSADKSFTTIPDAEIFKKLQETLTSRSELEREMINRNREITKLREELSKGATSATGNFNVTVQEKERVIIELTREIETLRKSLTEERAFSSEFKKNDLREVLTKFKSEYEQIMREIHT